MLNKVCTFSIGTAFLSGAVTTADDSANPKKPNVILVLTDDQGYGDLSCHGNLVINL